LQFSGKEGHERFGRAFDVDDVDVKAVLLKKPMSLAAQKTDDEPALGEM
jgi:hypothetical protein